MPETNDNIREWWYLDESGEKQGPIPFAALLTLNEVRVVNAQTLVWQVGTREWRSLGDVVQDRVVACKYFSFVCRKLWTELDATASSDIRYCNDCARQVHLCHSVAELHMHSRSGHCVAWRMPRELPEVTYLQVTYLGVPAPPPRTPRWWQFWKKAEPEERW